MSGIFSNGRRRLWISNALTHARCKQDIRRFQEPSIGPRRLCRPPPNPTSRGVLPSPLFASPYQLDRAHKGTVIRRAQRRCLNQFAQKHRPLGLRRLCRVLRIRRACLSPFPLSSSTIPTRHLLLLLRRLPLHQQMATRRRQKHHNNPKTMAQLHRKAIQSNTGSISCFRPSRDCPSCFNG